MIGLVIVAHGALATELLAATEHVVGPLRNATAIAIAPNDDLYSRQADVDSALEQVNDGDGVVVITDMFGGSPSNLAMGAFAREDVEVIYGANLPLLVKFAKCRERPLAEAVDCALEAGRKYLDSATRIMSAKKLRA